MKIYQWSSKPNVGDTLGVVIAKHFLGREYRTTNDHKARNKFLIIGSVLRWGLPGDIAWGVGILKPAHHTIKGVKVLAVRGRLTREYIHGVMIPEVYGDPGLLMPLVYHPPIEKKRAVGIIPHWSDAGRQPDGYAIHVTLHWRPFIREILSCERVISSSLHGIVLAEAYGIPAEWASWGKQTAKQYIKYQDYLTGTDREIQGYGPLPPIPDIGNVQRRLLKALEGHCGKLRNC